MKKLRVFIVVLLALSVTALLYAAETTNITPGNKGGGAAAGTTDALQNKPGMKAERGVKNILFGWTDIPRSIIQVTKDSKNAFWGLTAGTFKGIGKAFPRTVSGIADVVTFPITYDKSYERTPVKPDELKTQIQ